MAREVFDVVVSGDTFCDLVFLDCRIPDYGKETFAKGFALSPGGAANQAVAACRLGASVSLLSSFGKDPLGSLIRRQLEGEPGLDLSHCVATRQQTPVTVAITDGHDRAFATYSEPCDSVQWSENVPVGIAFVSLSRQLPEWALRLRSRGTLLAGNIGWDGEDEWLDKHSRALSQIDILFINEMEAKTYTHKDSLDEAVDALLDYVVLVIVTRGGHGVYAAKGSQRWRVPSLPVEAVDPTGAGDVFSAACAVGLSWHWPIEDSLRLGCCVAAYSVRHPGGAANAPSRNDMRRLLDALSLGYGDSWMRIRQWLEQ